MQSRNSPVSARICSGLSSLGRNRMKPHGWTSATRAFSASVSRGPLQPSLAAVVTGRSTHEAIAAAGLARIAETRGLFAAQARDGGAIDGRAVRGRDLLHPLVGPAG